MNPALDLSELDHFILCIQCKTPLWHQKILKVIGNRVASSQTLPVHDLAGSFSSKTKDCPVCGKLFFGFKNVGSGRREQVYLLRNYKTGLETLT